ncbi:MAG: hypothetical protein ACLQT6_16420 [Desulfomonilaceae bacterium]
MELESVYNQIKNDYFPRWDCNNEWQLKFVDDLHGAQASCSSELKTITLVKDCFIHQSAFKINQLKVILIHEISHTTTRGFHGEEWITQMEKTAERADQLGEIELAQFIREEVDRYVMRNKIDKHKGTILGKTK